jgi:threonine aldolase
MPAPDGRVDLRSDTVTRPTAAMRRAMSTAEVGDDGFGDDPTVIRLEEVFAARVGKERALLVPSGTMGNQIALRVHARVGGLIVAGRRQHLVTHEGGAAGINQVAQLHVLDDGDGTIDAAEVGVLVEAAAHRWPAPSVVCIEDTHLASGGRPWPQAQIAAVAATGVPMHLDGARLFNAEVATGVPAASRAAHAATVMCCMTKGLGAPVGSLLAGSADLIDAARVERKRLGGGMRQAGIIAAAALVALDQHVERLAEDHVRARRLAEAVADRWPDAGCQPEEVQTNIVLFRHADTTAVLRYLDGEGIRGVTVAPGIVRFVTHLDVDDDDIERACVAIKGAES